MMLMDNVLKKQKEDVSKPKNENNHLNKNYFTALSHTWRNKILKLPKSANLNSKKLIKLSKISMSQR